jgi:uncharacterized membrane protein
MVYLIFIILLFFVLVVTFIYDVQKSNCEPIEKDEEAPLKKECACYKTQALKELPSYHFSKDLQKRIIKKLK